MNPICVKCEIQMRCAKNGFLVAPKFNPRHQYNGDLYRCPECGQEVAVDFGTPFESTFKPNLLLEN
jgi:transposase-like protein